MSTTTPSPITQSTAAKLMLLPLITVLIWSVNIMVNQWAVDVVAPMTMSFMRWLVAFVALTPIMLPKVWRTRRLIRPHLPKLALLGIMGMVMYQGFAYIAAHTTSATNMGIINAFIPVFTMLVAAVVMRDRPSRLAVIGVLISLFGLSMIMGQGNPISLLAQGVHMGDGLMILGCLIFSLYGVLLRVWRLPLDLWTMLYVQIGVAVLVQMPFFFAQPDVAVSLKGLPLVLYAGLFPSLLAPFLWARAIHHLGPNRTSVFMNLMPVFTAALAALCLHEQLAWYHLLGGGLMLVGVALTQVNIDNVIHSLRVSLRLNKA